MRLSLALHDQVLKAIYGILHLMPEAKMPHTKAELLSLPAYICIISAILETKEVEEIEKEPLLNNTLRRGTVGMSHIIVTALIKKMIRSKE